MSRIHLLRVVLPMVVTLAGGTLFAQVEEGEEALKPEQRVDEVFARWDTTNSPGCAVSVIRDGEVVFKKGYGMANLDHDIPIRTDTVFHVASVSKEFTAAAIALLALDGNLSLDDPVGVHLSWMPDLGHPVTIRNLVHHNSGIRDQWSLLGMSGWRYSRDLITDEDVIYLLRRQRDLNFPPGQRYLYSNSGYTLMSLIVQKVSGMTLREFTSQRIFQPLGMTRTHFRDDFSEIVKDQAYGYRWDDDQAAFKLSVTNFDTVGATSLLTTVEDMARWDRNFIQPAVGGPEFLRLLHQRGTLSDGEQQSYAFGLIHGTYRGLPTVGHGGSDAGYRSHYVRFPEQGYSFVTLCNLAQTNPARLARNVADIYLADHLQPLQAEASSAAQPVPLSEVEREQIAGSYWSDERGTPFRIETHQDSLRLRLGGRTMEMVHTGSRRFTVSDLDRVIEFQPAGGPVRQAVAWPEEEPGEREVMQRLEPFEISAEGLSEFAGEYRSPELPVAYSISLGDGVLTVEALKRQPAKLTPVAKDLFLAEGVGTLRFTRDGSGGINGFMLDSGRIRGFRFTKTL